MGRLKGIAYLAAASLLGTGAYVGVHEQEVSAQTVGSSVLEDIVRDLGKATADDVLEGVEGVQHVRYREGEHDFDDVLSRQSTPAVVFWYSSQRDDPVTQVMCKRSAIVLKQLAGQYEGVRFIAFDTSRLSQEELRGYSVRTVPSMSLYHTKDRLTGQEGDLRLIDVWRGGPTRNRRRRAAHRVRLWIEFGKRWIDSNTSRTEKVYRTENTLPNRWSERQPHP